MRVIHIISSLNKINFGVFNAAIFAHDFMRLTYGVESELWVCSDQNSMDVPLAVPHFFYKKHQLKKEGFFNWLDAYPSNDTIIISHGAWRKPSKLGFWAAQKGYLWIYTPHGMFANYTTIENGKLVKYGLLKGINKKWLYYTFKERKYIKKASAIRAVSENEQQYLKVLLGREIELIYNGILSVKKNEIVKDHDVLKVVFLSRLHKVKGITNLIKAWHEVMAHNNKFILIIAGPDEGELVKIKPFFTSNVEYIGTIYGDSKIELLKKANYYILPSFCEGFPTSLVEAMSYGAIPLATDACNFPEIFEFNLGYKIEPEKESIKKVLNIIANKEYDSNLSLSNIQYVENNLTEKKIAADYYNFYNKVINKK